MSVLLTVHWPNLTARGMGRQGGGRCSISTDKLNSLGWEVRERPDMGRKRNKDVCRFGEQR
jgi:hypothetical protein